MVFSSWLSIQPSTDQQYREMQALEAANPGHITGGEWVSGEMDATMKALGLLIVGVPSFIILTGSVAGITAARRKLRWVWLFLGVSWMLLAALLHLLVWNL